MLAVVLLKVAAGKEKEELFLKEKRAERTWWQAIEPAAKPDVVIGTCLHLHPLESALDN